MKSLVRFCLLLVILSGVVYYMVGDLGQENRVLVEQNGFEWRGSQSPITFNKQLPNYFVEQSEFNESVFAWIGSSVDKLTDTLGEPLREDLSRYGYSWWVYTDEKDFYMQFGVQEGSIVTVYATGNSDLHIPLQIGADYTSLAEQFTFHDTVSFSTYNFKLTEEDLTTRPLVKIGDDQYLQLYFDTVTNTLSSFRLMNSNVLLKQQPYALQYIGPLPKEERLTDEQVRQVERGEEQQVFQITNVIRNRFDRPNLKWDEAAQVVAYEHSKDMAVNDYFSHTSLDGRELGDRLQEADIVFRRAGENLAAKYPDAPAAVEGWLNSEGHRQALLESDFNYLGVGVFQDYYTQNFLRIEGH